MEKEARHRAKAQQSRDLYQEDTAALCWEAFTNDFPPRNATHQSLTQGLWVVYCSIVMKQITKSKAEHSQQVSGRQILHYLLPVFHEVPAALKMQ